MNKSLLFKTTAGSIALTCLAGCMPHLNQQQCRDTNWYQVGMSDGSQGQYPRDLASSITDCAKFKLKVDTQAYQKGWRAGTRQYCQPNTGFNIGTQGGSFNNICPTDQVGAFTAAYKRGLRRYCIPTTGYELGRAGKSLPSFCAPDLNVAFSNAYRRGSRIFNQLVSLQNQLNDINKTINDNQNQIDSNNQRIDQAIQHHHRRDRQAAKRQNRELQADLDRLNDTKNSLQQQISAIQGNS